MELQLADANGVQLRSLNGYAFDCELNDGGRDFALTIPIDDYNSDFEYRNRVFIDGTEFGGIIGKRTIETAENTCTIEGNTWRGVLCNKVIMPPSGQDYKVVSGELNQVIKNLVENEFSGLFIASTESTSVNVSNYQFDRFCTLYDGLSKMLESVGYRFELNYNQGDPNGCGCVEISALPIVDYSNQIELSQDSQLVFTISETKNGVNHLIAGGKGELQDRNIIHLYVDENGNIGNTQYFTGKEEISYFYENTSTETAELTENATEKLRELMNSQSFSMDVETLNIDVAIGDIIGGREYTTGAYISKPLNNIILKIDEKGNISKEYKLKGDE